MKQLKRKDLILEHYVPAMKATVIDNVTEKEITVRVWKPKTMGTLPAYDMLTMMNYEADRLWGYAIPEHFVGPKDKGAVWVTNNPDHGAWDLQTVIRMDYKKQQVDIYVCALLVRPFSREAADHYEQRMGFDVWDRLLLMWDSRQFDEEGGYKPVAGYDFNHPDGDRRYKSYDDLYRVINEGSDIAEGTF